MSFSRGQLITRALRIVGDTSLTTAAREWFDEVLLEIESVGYWHFNATSVSQATSTGVDNYTLPANYSKGLYISSSEPRVLIQVPHTQFLTMRATFAETGHPKYFAIQGNTLYVYPKPTDPFEPTLTLWFFKDIVLPTDDGNNIESVVGIKPKWQKYLVDGLIYKGFQYIDDQRQEAARNKWENDLLIMLKENDEYFSTQESKIDRPSLTARLESQETK